MKLVPTTTQNKALDALTKILNSCTPTIWMNHGLYLYYFQFHTNCKLWCGDEFKVLAVSVLNDSRAPIPRETRHEQRGVVQCALLILIRDWNKTDSEIRKLDRSITANKSFVCFDLASGLILLWPSYEYVYQYNTRGSWLNVPLDRTMNVGCRSGKNIPNERKLEQF